MRIIVTGGAGFIGSALVRHLVQELGETVCTVDSLTYSGNLANLDDVMADPRHSFEKVDICDTKAISELVLDFQPDAILHLAAESHVDRSIDGPAEFIQTNIVGTFNLLEVSREYASGSTREFRFIHISTDEVFGSLGRSGKFTEQSPYHPNSPYAASKAASDHLALAWHKTYGLPTIVTNCSNNYGPYQFPEKLIPLTIANAAAGRMIPVYGDGLQVRDWLYVEDHVVALTKILSSGSPGQRYNIGGNSEKTNLDIVSSILDSVAHHLEKDRQQLNTLVTHVEDRPGHDRRYAIDSRQMERELGWIPEVSFEEGMDATVRWYLTNESWCKQVAERYSGARLGLMSRSES